MNDLALSVGSIHKQDGANLRVIAVQDDNALLEQWRDETLIQYIIASHFSLDDGELYWHDSGSYFPCMYPPPICDTPATALLKAMTQLIRGEQALALDIPNGLQIIAQVNGGLDSNGWISMDTYVKFPDGQCKVICCADFDTQSGNLRGHDRLRVLTYVAGGDDPDATTLPLPHRSIWISSDEGTYDVNVWDEDLDTRDEHMEIGHITTLAEAERVMNRLIQDHPSIWTRRSLQNK